MICPAHALQLGDVIVLPKRLVLVHGIRSSVNRRGVSITGRDDIGIPVALYRRPMQRLTVIRAGRDGR